MAKNTEVLTIKVETETDQARRDLHALEEVADDIKIDVDTDEASRSISDLLADVDKLDSEQATIKLELEQENLGRQLEAIRADVEKLDASDATIDLKMEQGDKLIGDIDQIQAKLKEINDTEVKPDTSQLEGGLSRADQGTRDLSDSARGANSALANMIGNSAQDLGALGGFAGSAGVAIGQMAEYAADATLGGEALGKSLLSMAAVAGPIAALTIGVSLFSKAMEAASKEAKDQAELARNAADAWQEFLGITDDLQTGIQGVGESAAFTNDSMVALGLSLFQGITKGDNATEDLREVNEALLNLNVVTADTTAPDYFRVLGGELALLGTAQENLGNLPDLQPWQDAVAGLAITSDELDPARFGEITTAVSGLSAALVQSAPSLAGYGDEVAYAISKGDDAAEIVDYLADALIASGKATAASAHDTAQAIYDGNKLVIDSYENLDDVVDSSVLNDFATDALDKAAGSSLELASAILEIRKANPDASEFEVWQLLQGYIEDSGFAMREFEKQVAQLNFDPLESDQFADLVADVKDGTVDIANFDQVVEGLAKAWNISEDAVRQYILQEADKQIDDEAAAAEEATKAQEEYAQAIADARSALANLAEVDTAAIASGLQDALDVADDFLGHLKFQEDFQHQFDAVLEDADKFVPDLQELLDLQARGIEITPDITLGNLESDDAEFLAWAQSVQNMVQEGAVEAFQHGGTDSANAFLQAQAAAFVAAHPQFTEADFYRLVGLPPDGTLDAIINPVIATEKLTAIQPIIDNLVNSGVLSPEIALQISALNIDDPEAALALAVQVLQSLGIEVPVQLQPDTDAFEEQMSGVVTTPWGTTVQVGAATDQTFTDTAQQVDEFGNPVNVTVIAPKSPSLGAMDKLIDHVARDRDVDLNVKADNAGAIDTILNAVAEDRVATYFSVVNEGSRANADKTIDNVARDRVADINVKADDAGRISSILDAIAHDRTVHLRVHIDNYNEVERQLDQLARPRTQTITTRLGGARTGAAVN